MERTKFLEAFHKASCQLDKKNSEKLREDRLTLSMEMKKKKGGGGSQSHYCYGRIGRIVSTNEQSSKRKMR